MHLGAAQRAPKVHAFVAMPKRLVGTLLLRLQCLWFETRRSAEVEQTRMFCSKTLTLAAIKWHPFLSLFVVTPEQLGGSSDAPTFCPSTSNAFPLFSRNRLFQDVTRGEKIWFCGGTD